MRATATEARKRFGSLCAQAKREPVSVEKTGQLDTVILSAEQYLALQANHDKARRAARERASNPGSATGSPPRTPGLESTASPASS